MAAAILTRFIRTAVREELGRDYVRTADSKGIPAATVLRGHVMRNAFVPVLTVVGVQLASLLGGVIVEVLFATPGLGLLTYQAVEVARSTRAARRGPTRAARLNSRRSPRSTPTTWPAPSTPTSRARCQRERVVSAAGGEVVAAVEDLHVRFRCGPRRAGARCAPSTESRWRSRAARRWAWWGSPAAASRPPAGAAPPGSARPPEPSAFSART